MKFLVVLTATVACAFARPGLLPGAITTYTSIAAAPIATHFAAAPIATPFAAAPIAAPLAAAAIATPLAAAAIATPLAAQSKYHIQDSIGQASYGHAEPLQTHNAIQDAAGNKIGSFSYLSPDGNVLRTDYVADALGYRVASNALPVGPSLPIADTPEVAAAKYAHLAAKGAILLRRRRGIVAPLAIGHTPAATAPLGAIAAPFAAPLAAPIAAPLAAPIAAPLAAHIAAPLAAPLALGHTPAATAPLAAPIASPYAATIAAPLGAPIASPYAATIAAPLGAPIASPLAATIAAPLGAPIASPYAATIAALLAIGHTPAATAPLGAIAAGIW